jgi:peptidyl-prolyl cis-trans isomerase SurA
MKTGSRPLLRSLVLIPALLAVAAAALSAAQAPPKPAPKAAPKPAQKAPAAAASTAASPEALKDRVLAVVDDDPILGSDVERVVRLGLETPKPGEAPAVFRRRVLDELIEQRLQFHEIDRFGFEQVPVDEIQRRVAAIRARFPDEGTFQKALKEVGLDPKGLRQLVTRQLLVLTYVDERLGPSVFVTPDDVNRYYRDVLMPEMQKRGQAPPPLDQVREDIRETLKQQKMTAQMESWTKGLREKADVLLYSAEAPAGRPLPPVVKTLRSAPKKDTAKKDTPKKDAAKQGPAKKPPL